MSWKSEFPNYDGKFHMLEGWEDYSWNNDTCPHIEKRGICKETEVKMCIWQDYVDINRREYDANKRFILNIEVNNDCVFWFETDDWSEMETIAKGADLDRRYWIDE